MNNNLDEKRCSSCNCIVDILENILCLQRKVEILEDKFIGCDKPFLGPCPSSKCFNTRPVQLLTNEGELFEVECESGQRTNVFRVEKIDGCCVTFRCLKTCAPLSEWAFKKTDVFFTLNFGTCCFGIKCLEDTFVECL